MASVSDTLYAGLIYGRLPGQKKDWVMFYLTVSTTQLNIFEGNEDLSQPRKHMRSLGIGSDDTIGEDKGKKKEYRFFVQRADGKYIFKCDTQEQRDNWIAQLQRLVNRKEFENMQGFTPPTAETFDPSKVGSPPTHPRRYDVPIPPTTPPAQKRQTATLPGRGTSFSRDKHSVINQPLPPIPSLHNQTNSGRRVSVTSDDSGIGASNEGEIRRNKNRMGSSSVPASGDGTFRRHLGPVSPKSQSDGGKFNVRQVVQVEEVGDPEELENYRWFWGSMSRRDCEDRLRVEGEVGNFVVRINATGNYVMSFWRTDTIHHHKISQYGNMFRFERAAVSADGCSLVDLLDTYMKNCADRSIKPLGGELFLKYDEPWNPPPLDMEKLGQRLREQKDKKEHHRSPNQPKKFKSSDQESAPHKPRPKDRYDPIDLRKPKKNPSDAQVSPSEPRRGSAQDEQQPALGGKKKPLPKPPTKHKPPVVQPSPEHLQRLDSSGKFKVPPSTPSAREQTRQTRVEDTSRRPGWAMPGASEIRQNSQTDFASSLESSLKQQPPQTAKKPAKPTPATKPKPAGRGPLLPEQKLLSPVQQSQQASQSPQYANLKEINTRESKRTLSPPYQNVESWTSTPSQPSPKSNSIGRGTQSHGMGPNPAASPATQGMNGEQLNSSEGVYQNVSFAPPPPPSRRRKN